VSLVSKLLSSGFGIWFAFSQILFGMSAAYAQNELIDVEPPLIEHTVDGEMEATSRQHFVATVVDDAELDSVSLFYRFKDDPTYSTVLMKRVSYSSTYIVHIPTDPDEARDIEYYIQAIDKAGNRTVRGYAFNPLLRKINPASVATESTQAQTSPSMFESIGKRKTALYVVLGVLAVGAVVASADLNGSDPEGCPNGQCRVTVTVEQPPQ